MCRTKSIVYISLLVLFPAIEPYYLTILLPNRFPCPCVLYSWSVAVEINTGQKAQKKH